MPPYLPLAFAAALLSAATHAQWQPARPVQMIVPNPPGGGPDFIARLLAPRLSEAAKQNVVVDNRSSNNGIVGAEAAAVDERRERRLDLVDAAEAVQPLGPGPQLAGGLGSAEQEHREDRLGRWVEAERVGEQVAVLRGPTAGPRRAPRPAPAPELLERILL